MPDQKNDGMLEPFRAIGLRFVATCQTCLAPCAKDLHIGSFISRADRVGALVCNRYELDKKYVALVLQDRAGILASLPVAHAAQLDWVVCSHPGCGWSGWNTELILHLASRGVWEEDVWSRHCPKCEAEIETKEPRGELKNVEKT
jgi:hypothetical protein